MKYVYMVRHQAGGFLPDFIFESEPTEEQLAPIIRLMAFRHGAQHPVDGSMMWTRVCKLAVIAPGEPVTATIPSGDPTIKSSLGPATPFVASGEGKVG